MPDHPKATICRICKENCGILVRNDGCRVQLVGNPDHPISRGFICFRGRHYGEVHQSPERLRTPLMRKGAGHVTVSWEEALDLLASRLLASKERHGPQSVALLKGESLKHQEVAQYLRHLAYGFGTPNFLTVSSLCHEALALGHGLTYGSIPLPAFETMKTAILWAVNPAVSMPLTWSRLQQAVKKGTRLVAVDPSHTQSSRNAALHLAVNPGADGFLALAFLKHAIEAVGLNPTQAQGTTGWADLETMVAGLSLSELLGRAGISDAQFAEARALIFSHLPAWIHTGLGLELHPCGVQTIRTIALLQALLDPENRPTPAPFPLNPLPGADRYPDRPDPIGFREVPIYCSTLREGHGMVWSRAILDDDPYPVRSMLIVGANPLLTFPTTSAQVKALARLDFLAVFDLFMTSTAELADLVLPAADTLGSFELHDYHPTGEPCLGLIRPVVPRDGTWPAWKLIFELGKRLGLGELFPWADNAQALAYRLQGTGVTPAELMSSSSSTVSYPSTSASASLKSVPPRAVHWYSGKLDTVGQAPLPYPQTLTLPAVPEDQYPFWLSTGDRLRAYQHSQFRQCASYLAEAPEPCVEIHPEAAATLGIDKGDVVQLATPTGAIRVRASHDSNLRKDCLRMVHGWQEVNANELTSFSHLDPISGFPWMRALPARIEKI